MSDEIDDNLLSFRVAGDGIEQMKAVIEARKVTDLFETRCPVCGERNDYCTGHGLMGDPTGWTIMTLHDGDEHHRCHPAGCDVALEAAKARHPSSGQRLAAKRPVFTLVEDDDSLGPCGCVDYHLNDCPVRSLGEDFASYSEQYGQDY